MRKLMLRGLVLSLLGTGLFMFGSGLTIPAKALLSVHLMDSAWSRTLDGEAEARPWPWMDSHPVARLNIPKFGQQHVVMSGVSGAIMAFAPGWHEGTELPGKKGISLISAHRDTHFEYLKDMGVGDSVFLTTADGQEKHYQISDVRIVDSPEIQVQDSPDESVLVLSTCYPFNNWQVGGEMRFVAIAKEIKGDTPMNLAGL